MRVLWVGLVLALSGCNGAAECTTRCETEVGCGVEDLLEACISRCMDTVEALNGIAPHCGDWQRHREACVGASSCEELALFDAGNSEAPCLAYAGGNRPATCAGTGAYDPITLGPGIRDEVGE